MGCFLFWPFLRSTGNRPLTLSNPFLFLYIGSLSMWMKVYITTTTTSSSYPFEYMCIGSLRTAVTATASCSVGEMNAKYFKWHLYVQTTNNIQTEMTRRYEDEDSRFFYVHLYLYIFIRTLVSSQYLYTSYYILYYLYIFIRNQELHLV